MGGAIMSGSKGVGISVGSLFPQSFLPWYGLRYAVDVAQEAGYESLQLLPFWTYTRNELANLSKIFSVVSFEGSWNRMYFDTRTTWGRLKKFDMGLLKDTLLFGIGDRVGRIITHFYELFPSAISIDINPMGVREISPHHRMSREEWLNYKGGVVFDTYHIFEFPFIRSSGNAAQFAEDLFNAGFVTMIHVQIRDKEKLEDFLSYERCSFEDYILSIMCLYLCDTRPSIVVEIHPTILPFSKKERVKVLGAVRKRIGGFLGE